MSHVKGGAQSFMVIKTHLIVFGLEEWIEEDEASLEGPQFSNREKAIFLLDHLGR